MSNNFINSDWQFRYAPMSASYTGCYRLFIGEFAGINEFFASYTVGDRFLKAQKNGLDDEGLNKWYVVGYPMFFMPACRAERYYKSFFINFCLAG